MSKRILVAGIGTDVGKTVVSAILMKIFAADYWKPVECGDSDSIRIRSWMDSSKYHVHKPSVSLKASVSPHHAARLERSSIDIDRIQMPKTERNLIIESTGGIFVPLSFTNLTLDLYQKWDCEWVVVVKHYLGSINHALLTLKMLQMNSIHIKGVIFNGEINPDSEQAILHFSESRCLGRLFPEKQIYPEIFHKYAAEWKQNF